MYVAGWTENKYPPSVPPEGFDSFEDAVAHLAREADRLRGKDLEKAYLSETRIDARWSPIYDALRAGPKPGRRSLFARSSCETYDFWIWPLREGEDQ